MGYHFQGVAAMLGARTTTASIAAARVLASCRSPRARSTSSPTGSRLAIKHFTEYLERFPDDLEARWLMNIAHMTLGEYPQGVDKRYLVSLDRFNTQEFNIGKFRDIGHIVGVNRFNQAGGSVMEDFDNDGRLDLAGLELIPRSPLVVLSQQGRWNVRGTLTGGGLRWPDRRPGLLSDRLQ